MTHTTMTCEQCHAQIDADARHCPQCGAPASPVIDREAEVLLSQANVARVRKQFAEAEAICVDVLRRDPNNAHAHSLLGDLYRDQGRLHDAAQWYRMALDLSADSPADRAKLRNVEDILARSAAERSASGDLSRTQKLLGLSPVVWIRVITVVVVVFLVGATAVLLAGRTRNRATSAALRRGGAVPSATGSGPERGWPVAPPRTSMTTVSPGAGAPATSPGPSTSSTTPAAPAAAGTVQQRVVAEEDGRTAQEDALKTALNTQGGLTGGGSVTSVLFINNDSTVVLTMTRPGALNSASAEALRAAVVRDAFRAAQQTFQAVPQAQRVAVAVRLAGSGSRPAPAFDGQVDRQAVMRADRSADPARLTEAFSSVWWAPEIAPAEQLGNDEAAL